jgi:hypothetical protein
LICSGWPCWSFRPSISVLAVALRCLIGWMAACNPDVAPRCCARPLGHEHDAAPLVIAASGWWPPCHNRGCADASPPWPSASLLCELTCEFLLFPLFLCSCYGGMASEPCMLAYAAVVSCLSLCCCYPRAPLLATVYCYCEFQCKVQCKIQLRVSELNFVWFT